MNQNCPSEPQTQFLKMQIIVQVIHSESMMNISTKLLSLLVLCATLCLTVDRLSDILEIYFAFLLQVLNTELYSNAFQ